MRQNDATTDQTEQTALTALVPIWDSGEETLVFPPSGKFVCGTAKDCAAKVLVPGVGQRHCRLICRTTEIKIEPFGSHAVSVNDVAVFGSQVLNAGDVVSIGPAKFRVERRHESLMCRVNVKVPKTAIPKRISATSAERPADSPAPAAKVTPAVSNVQPSVPSPIAPAASVRIEESNDVTSQIADMQQQITDVLTPGIPQPSLPAAAFQQPAPLMPVLAGATQDNRRRLLDAREAQLTEWHASLELRRAELDNRSTTLARQQATLIERQAEFEARVAELELQHAERTRTLHAKNDQVAAEAKRQLAAERAELAEHDQKLEQERTMLDAQAERVEESKRAVAAQMKDLAEARRTLSEERQQYKSEQKAASEELQNRETALQDQQQQLHVREESVRDLESVQETVERRSAELDAQQIELTSRAEELSELEAIREDVTQREAAVRELQEEVEQRAQEYLELEELRTDVEFRENELQEQLAELKPQLEAVARLEAIATEMTERENNLEAQRTAVESEAVQVSSAASEVAAEWQRIEDARQELADVAQKQNELQTQTEELNSQLSEIASAEASLETQRTELEQLAASQQQREVELAAEREAFEQTQTTASALSSSSDELAAREAQLAELSAEIEASRSQIEERETAVNERDDELTKLGELLQSQAEELATAAQAPSPVDDAMSIELEQLRKSLAEAQAQSETVETERDELQQKLAELAETFEAEKKQLQANAEAVALTSNEGSDADGTEMLLQIAELKAELESVATSDVATSELQSEVQQQESTIAELNQQLQDALQQVADLTAANEVGSTLEGDSEAEQYRTIIEQLTQKVEESNNTIASLQAAVESGGSVPEDASTGPDAEEIRILHRELDDRTNLLDIREEDLREQLRMLEQTKADLEEQRRAMLEARQQLEVARADIHVANTMHMESLTATQVEELKEETPVEPLPEAEVESPPQSEPAAEKEAETETESAEETPAVRSEIAELFGLSFDGGGDSGGATSDSVELPDTTSKYDDAFESTSEVDPAKIAAELMSAVDDYSQEKAAAVSMSFADANDVLLESVADEENAEAPVSESIDEPATEDEHDDFVSQYMEQLLSRNREGAGGALPSELQKPAPSAASEKPKAKEPEKPKAPGQVSFIDQYMSGNFGGSDDDAAKVASEGQNEEPVKPIAPRAKVDLEAMRNNMNSFRELSTKSVENALATHAKRQRRGGIVSRSSLFVVLGSISFLVVTASLMNVIPFGIVTWISVAAAGLSGADLLLKMRSQRDSGTDDDFSAEPLTAPSGTAAVDGAMNTDGVPAVGIHQPEPGQLGSDAPGPAAKEPEEQYFEL